MPARVGSKSVSMRKLNLVIFFSLHLFVAVVRGLAAVSGWRGLGAVCMCFPGRQTLSGQGLACLRARKPAANNNIKKRGRPAQKKRSRPIPAAAYGPVFGRNVSF